MKERDGQRDMSKDNHSKKTEGGQETFETILNLTEKKKIKTIMASHSFCASKLAKKLLITSYYKVMGK